MTTVPSGSQLNQLCGELCAKRLGLCGKWAADRSEHQRGTASRIPVLTTPNRGRRDSDAGRRSGVALWIGPGVKVICGECLAALPTG
jgi:hypothetical protein